MKGVHGGKLWQNDGRKWRVYNRHCKMDTGGRWKRRNRDGSMERKRRKGTTTKWGQFFPRPVFLIFRYVHGYMKCGSGSFLAPSPHFWSEPTFFIVVVVQFRVIPSFFFFIPVNFLFPIPFPEPPGVREDKEENKMWVYLMAAWVWIPSPHVLLECVWYAI